MATNSNLYYVTTISKIYVIIKLVSTSINVMQLTCTWSTSC